MCMSVCACTFSPKRQRIDFDMFIYIKTFPAHRSHGAFPPSFLQPVYLLLLLLSPPPALLPCNSGCVNLHFLLPLPARRECRAAIEASNARCMFIADRIEVECLWRVNDVCVCVCEVRGTGGGRLERKHKKDYGRLMLQHRWTCERTSL